MTAVALTGNSNNACSALGFERAVMPKIGISPRSGTLAALDLTGRAVEATESALRGAATAINAAIPATARFIGSFFLPEAINHPLEKALGLATRLTTSVIKGSFTAAVQAMTFGAPAWAQAFRQGVAVSAAISELQHNDSGSELLARCIAQGCRDAMIKEPLQCYIGLRKELAAVEAAGPSQTDRHAELSRTIVGIETRLRDYQDFRDIKMAFDNRSSFVEQQQKRLNEIASQTAERLISQTESFYQRELGWAGGAVAGRWAKGETAAERSAERDLLREEISMRLAHIFQHGLTVSETSAVLSTVAAKMHSAFGTYKHAFKGGLAVVGGVLIETGVVSDAFECVWNTVKAEIDAGLGWISDTAYSAVESVKDWAAEQLGAIGDRISDRIMNRTQAAFDDLGAQIDTALENGLETLRAVLPSDGPDYSAPYWSKTDKVWVGINPDGSPQWGHSCISGFPSRPRFDVEGLTPSAVDRLQAFGSQSSTDIESLLLPPRSPDLVLSSDEKNELLELLKASHTEHPAGQ